MKTFEEVGAKQALTGEAHLAPAVQWLMTMVTHIPVEASETVQELCGCLV